MLKPEALLCPKPDGLYCPPGDFYIDPVRPVARAHCFTVTRNVAFVRAVAYETDPDDPVAAARM